MDKFNLTVSADLAKLRETNAAWRLLASPLAPFVLSCASRLFDGSVEGTSVEDMESVLAEILQDNANHEEVEGNYLQQARRELREWIKRGLISERAGILYATDELQRTMDFIGGLQDRIMTSTASRLATVQGAIADLALQLSPDAEKREAELKSRIAKLEAELARVMSGEFEIRSGNAAVESIREVYDLATSLHTDFRRVEESFRQAERELRESLIRDGQHRGIALDKLLDSHDELIETTEGQVFAVFHEQLNDQVVLDQMRQQLREIAEHALESEALSRQQRNDLTRLVTRLIEESSRVIAARSRSDRDVKNFIKSGLAAEHLAIGRLLNELFETALGLDLSQRAVSHKRTHMPLVAVNLALIPTPERLRLTALEDMDELTLDLTQNAASGDEFDDSFWDSLACLDREAFYEQALALLADHPGTMTVGEITATLAPEHDLEAIAYLLGLASGLVVDSNGNKGQAGQLAAWERKTETFELLVAGCRLRYRIPQIDLNHAALRSVNWEAA